MKAMDYRWLIFCIFTLALAGCPPVTPGAPTPAVTPVTSTPLSADFVIPPLGSYTVEQRDAACLRDPVPDYGSRAHQQFNEMPIVWTFQVNFNVRSATGEPVGCLRLYDWSGSEYEAIDDGGILVDTCNVMGLPEILDAGPGLATLNGQGYVQCRMDLAKWVPMLADSPGGRLGHPPDRLRRLDSFPDTDWVHDYPSFTMVAQVASFSPTQETDAPLIYYAPDQATEVPRSLFAHLIKVQGTYLATFPFTGCMVDVVPISDVPQKWWYDSQWSAHTYEYQTNGGLQSTCPDASWLSATIPVWIGPATLYIGYDPTRDLIFPGAIDSVLIDPPDSKTVQ